VADETHVLNSDAGGDPAPLGRRRRLLIMIVAGAAVLAAAGMTAPLWIRSPQQVAAEAEPPARTVLTAEVESRVLRDTLVLRGDVRPGETIDVTPVGSGDAEPVVTAVKVRRGDPVRPGTVVLEVSGRPLIVLPGRIPAYRDLKPGARGADVAQLQKALDGLGFDPGSSDGEFDAGTKRALTGFYRSRGYEPLPVDPGDEERIAALNAQVRAAERQVADARDAAAATRADPAATAAQKAAADKTVRRAREDLTDARRTREQQVRLTGPMLPQREYTFLPRFPSRVDAMKARLRGKVVEPLITFAIGSLVVRATLTEAQHDGVSTGAAVRIMGDGGLEAEATVTSIGELETAPEEESATAPAAPPGYPMVVTPAKPLDGRFTGQNVRLSVETAVSDGEQLVVPVTALYGGADGNAYVTRRSGAGPEERIPVVPGMTAQGYVSVSAPDGILTPGDLVVVGEAPR